MRGDTGFSQVGDELGRIESLVSAQRQPPGRFGRVAVEHVQRRAPFGMKGGFSIASFDGSAEVRISVADRITFGPELQAAKSLIDECIESWSEGADPNIRVLLCN